MEYSEQMEGEALGTGIGGSNRTLGYVTESVLNKIVLVSMGGVRPTLFKEIKGPSFLI